MTGLPADAASWRDGNWSQQDELLARLIENVDRWGRYAAAQRGARRSELPDPEWIVHPDRPGFEVSKKPAASASEIGRFFARHMNGG